MDCSCYLSRLSQITDLASSNISPQLDGEFLVGGREEVLKYRSEVGRSLTLFLSVQCLEWG